MTIDEWLNEKLKEVAERLPTLVHQDPASFACGYNSGYKSALIEMQDILNKETPHYFENLQECDLSM